jgi:hypothetical protein
MKMKKLYSLVFAAFLVSAMVGSVEQVSAMELGLEDSTTVVNLSRTVTADDLDAAVKAQAKVTGASKSFIEENSFFSSVKSFVAKAITKFVSWWVGA